MKTYVLIILAIVTFGITNAQKSIDLSLKTDNGNLFKQDADIYTMPTIKILGLKTDAEFKTLEKSILANPYVAKFQYLDNAEADGARKALLSFKGNEEKTIVNFFKSINVKNIIINDKTFSVDQVEEIKAYVREIKAKKKAERNALPSKKRVSDPNE